MNKIDNSFHLGVHVEVKRIEEFISRHPSCAVCGIRDYSLADLDGAPISLWLSKSAMGQSALSVYAITCNNCGDVRLISQGSVP